MPVRGKLIEEAAEKPLRVVLEFALVFATTLVVGVGQIASIEDWQLQERLLSVLKQVVTTMKYLSCFALLTTPLLLAAIARKEKSKGYEKEENDKPADIFSMFRFFVLSGLTLWLGTRALNTIDLAETRLELPDLTISAMYSSFDSPPFERQPGLVVVVGNDGESESSPSTVQLTWVDRDGTRQTLSKELGPIAPHDWDSVLWSQLTGEVLAGEWSFFVEVDVDKDVEELDERNNTRRDTIIVIPRPG
jgi:hypothetical protein